MLEEKLLGMNSRSFELLFILRWEIVPLDGKSVEIDSFRGSFLVENLELVEKKC